VIVIFADSTMIHSKENPIGTDDQQSRYPAALLPGVNNGERFQGAISHPCASLSDAHNAEWRNNILRTLLRASLDANSAVNI